jgi:hypothetical protein
MDATPTPAARRLVAVLAAGAFGIAVPLSAVSIADAAVQRHHGHHGHHGHRSDWDRDKLPNRWELQYGLDAHSPNADEDPDADGLTNLAEYRAGTDPTNADTDADGTEDGDDADPTVPDTTDTTTDTTPDDPSDNDPNTRIATYSVR